MRKYLLDATVKYRVPSVEDVKKLHEEMQHNPTYNLTGFSYKTKYLKEKGEIVEEYQVITAKLEINEEKEPETSSLDFYISSVEAGESEDAF